MPRTDVRDSSEPLLTIQISKRGGWMCLIALTLLSVCLFVGIRTWKDRPAVVTPESVTAPHPAEAEAVPPERPAVSSPRRRTHKAPQTAEAPKTSVVPVVDRDRYRPAIQ